MSLKGPAWLNTKYTADDFSNNFSRTASGNYQLTADTGAEVDWDFCPNWSAGMRFDYIYKTNTRTISRVGSDGTALIHPLTAKSGTTIFSFALRYLIPGI